MSDTFDHEGDAWDSLDDMYGPERPRSSDYRPYRGGGGGTYSPRDPLFYHQKMEFKELQRENDYSFLIDGIWIPKKICKKMDAVNKTVYVNKNTYQRVFRS